MPGIIYAVIIFVTALLAVAGFGAWDIRRQMEAWEKARQEQIRRDAEWDRAWQEALTYQSEKARAYEQELSRRP